MSPDEFQDHVTATLGLIQIEQAETRKDINGINTRLDILNGSVARVTTRVNTLETIQVAENAAAVAVKAEKDKNYTRYIGPTLKILGATAVGWLLHHLYPLVNNLPSSH
jgi:hypothetical protein